MACERSNARLHDRGCEGAEIQRGEATPPVWSSCGPSSCLTARSCVELVRSYDRLGDGTAVAITAEYLQAVATRAS